MAQILVRGLDDALVARLKAASAGEPPLVAGRGKGDLGGSSRSGDQGRGPRNSGQWQNYWKAKGKTFSELLREDRNRR
jgi:hypothetical protein